MIISPHLVFKAIVLFIVENCKKIITVSVLTAQILHEITSLLEKNHLLIICVSLIIVYFSYA
jgi:hypothetical protein